MGPHELDLFFKRLFALRCPKVPCLPSTNPLFGRSIPNQSPIQPNPSKVIILLVLLVSWMEDDEGTQMEYGLIEYFSGVGRVAQMAEMGVFMLWHMILSTQCLKLASGVAWT